jgi:inward rectifier potassium channel
VTRRSAWRRERAATIEMGSYRLRKRGVAQFDWSDPYRLAVALSWPQFILASLALYLGVNLLFAMLYLAAPGDVANAAPGSFADLMFFSIETMATVGYGEMYPATRYGHLVASVEIMSGIAFTAILTGVIFVRFSRPRAHFLMAKHPIVTTHNGCRTLMLRVGNGQSTLYADARARISVLLSELSAEGTPFRRTHLLRLERDEIPVFPLTWTLMHVIDETSPLHDLDPARLVAADTRLFVALEARDPALSVSVHELRAYRHEDLLFGVRYVDVISDDDNGRPVADMTRIDETEALGEDRPVAPSELMR